jgi:hypothetical protein
MPIVRLVLSQWHPISMVCLFVAERGVIDRVHVSESLQEDTSRKTFWEAPASRWDGQPGRPPARGTRALGRASFDARTRGSTRLPLKMKYGIGRTRAVGHHLALPVWLVSLVPHVSHVSRQRNYARSKGAPRPLPSLSSPTHLIPTAKIECVGFLSKTWRKAGRFQAASRRLSVINSVGCLHRQFSVSSLEWAHAVRVGS